MSRGSFITLQQAIQMTTEYRTNREKMLEPSYQGKGTMPTCETFDKDLVEKVINQDGCVGLRIYFGMDGDDLVDVILVGVDGDDKDMLPPSASATEENENILENGIRCPVVCPPKSDLNP